MRLQQCLLLMQEHPWQLLQRLAFCQHQLLVVSAR